MAISAADPKALAAQARRTFLNVVLHGAPAALQAIEEGRDHASHQSAVNPRRTGIGDVEVPRGVGRSIHRRDGLRDRKYDSARGELADPMIARIGNIEIARGVRHPHRNDVAVSPA